jgi:hypothetical protein
MRGPTEVQVSHGVPYSAGTCFAVLGNGPQIQIIVLGGHCPILDITFCVHYSSGPFAFHQYLSRPTHAPFEAHPRCLLPFKAQPGDARLFKAHLLRTPVGVSVASLLFCIVGEIMRCFCYCIFQVLEKRARLATGVV